MQIIHNQTYPTHKNIINQLIEQSDKIIICVAFLKLSGLDFIIDKLKHKIGSCTFYIGTDYFLTEPNAVRKLLKQGHTVFRTQKSKFTFHPKIYYFKQGNSISILAGSANMTGGGLESNFEISILIQTKSNSTIDKEFQAAIATFSKSSSDFNDELLISQYESDFENYRQKHKKADKEFNNEIKKTHHFDLSKLSKYAAEYKADKKTAGRFEKRTEDYKIARNLFNKAIRKNISSSKEFLSHYDAIITKLHSSGLQRSKVNIARKYKTVLSIFKIVQTHRNIRPKNLFEKTSPYVKLVKGYGINHLTELMSTYNPSKYSVANGRTLKSLSKLKLSNFSVQNNFDAETYERYNDLINAIAAKCNFENLGQVDHFLSWYYDKYVPKKHKS